MLSKINSQNFPWDSIEKYRKLIKYDLSIGSPVDEVPESVQNAVAQCLNTNTYPLTSGTKELRETIANWLKTVRNVKNISYEDIIPTIGSKEAVAFLPMMLGVKENDIIVRPSKAYPTYDIGALACGAQIISSDNIHDWCDDQSICQRVKLIWVNSPNNPTGRILSIDELKEIVTLARKINAVVVSDECYALFNWQSQSFKPAPSILDDEVSNGNFDNLLMLYSLSKQLNMAGYRSAFMAGDKNLIRQILHIRKQTGLIMPQIIQNATIAALMDQKATDKQLNLYYQRYLKLKSAFIKAGYDVEYSDGGLYLWVNISAKHQNCMEAIEYFANKQILFAPGVFYDKNATNYIRVSLTANDGDIEQVIKAL